jgi:hypothetical protein
LVSRGAKPLSLQGHFGVGVGKQGGKLLKLALAQQGGRPVFTRLKLRLYCQDVGRRRRW